MRSHHTLEPGSGAAIAHEGQGIKKKSPGSPFRPGWGTRRSRSDVQVRSEIQAGVQNEDVTIAAVLRSGLRSIRTIVLFEIDEVRLNRETRRQRIGGANGIALVGAVVGAVAFEAFGVHVAGADRDRTGRVA